MRDYEQIVSTPDGTVLAEYDCKQQCLQYQSEANLEQAFIQKLVSQGYEYLNAKSEPALLENLRKQIQHLNGITFTDAEWDRFFSDRFTDKSRVQKARDIQIGATREVFRFDDGHEANLMLLDKLDLTRNKLQVLNQYEVIGSRKNRYDVTILANGIPMVHIELKRRGLDIQEAYRQISRYEEQSFWAGCRLYEYVQVFMISNGSMTRYYGASTRYDKVNKSRNAGFELTNVWADFRNRPINDLMDVAQTLLATRTLLSVLTRYCVLDSEDKLRILRPYQIAACEAVLNRIKNMAGMGKCGARCGGYIWHTMGSGKTLTSFKTAQLASELPEVDKVLFIVDRQDLDSQTVAEYKKFAGSEVDDDFVSEVQRMTALDKILSNPAAKIVITTIQKLDRFVKKHKSHPAYNLKVAMIFDECHRSQFGNMHKNISGKFKKYYAFGFTGTPIFEDNAISATATMLARKTSGAMAGIVTTTEQLFGPRLHSYLITDAIRDGTVVKFKLSYTNTAQADENASDEEVDGADFEKTARQWERIEAVSEYILEHFNAKTKHNAGLKFNSILACASVDAACRYYVSLTQMIKEKNLDIRPALIYTYGANDEILEDIGLAKDDFLEKRAMADYNVQFGTAFDLTSFREYKNDISRRMKGPVGVGNDQNTMIDILIVVDMFLTGFDSARINTLWVDKPLQYHGLLQAFSRTNRRCGKSKSHGEIVCFRNLKPAVDNALSLFTDKDAGGVLLVRTYGEYYNGYTDNEGKTHEGYAVMADKLLTAYSYQHLTRDIIGEAEKAGFVELFGQILVTRNILNTFDEFVGNEIITGTAFDDYKAWYLKIHDEMMTGQGRRGPGGGETLDGLVFHVDLIEESVMNIDEILMKIQARVAEAGVIDSDMVSKIQKAVDASVTIRHKSILIKMFIAQVNNGGNASAEAWTAMVEGEYRKAVGDVVAGLNLRGGAERYILGCVHSGTVKTAGDALESIMPPVRRFGGGDRTKIRQDVIEAVQKIVDKFCGIV